MASSRGEVPAVAVGVVLKRDIKVVRTVYVREDMAETFVQDLSRWLVERGHFMKVKDVTTKQVMRRRDRLATRKKVLAHFCNYLNSPSSW